VRTDAGEIAVTYRRDGAALDVTVEGAPVRSRSRCTGGPDLEVRVSA
jgi:hypothetical protein